MNRARTYGVRKVVEVEKIIFIFSRSGYYLI